MLDFKGCGKKIRAAAECGDLGYCRKCLRARIEYLEERLMSLRLTYQETFERNEKVLRAEFKAESADWRRTTERE